MGESELIHRRSSQRTSLYLIRRADALLSALRFFTGSAGNFRHRRLRFLAQSDFWEWEIDNLIYSFTNLAERRETWRSPKSAVEKLGKLGIAIDAKLLKAATWRKTWHGRVDGRGQWKGNWSVKQAGQRIAPVALLKEVIDLWNQVIDLAEQQFVAPMQEKARMWNMQTRPNLHSLRRSMPKLDEMDAE